MTRKELEDLVWKKTHNDYKSNTGGKRSILHLDKHTGGTTLSPLSALTPDELLKHASLPAGTKVESVNHSTDSLIESLLQEASSTSMAHEADSYITDSKKILMSVKLSHPVFETMEGQAEMGKLLELTHNLRMQVSKLRNMTSK